MSEPTKKIKGLDAFSKKFLFGDTSTSGPAVEVQNGWKANPDLLAKYQEERQLDFLNRAGAFTTDLLGFFKEQRGLRGLSDVEAIFAVALFAINLREAFGEPQTEEEAKNFTAEKKAELLKQFDTVAYGAQSYYDANKNDS